jgi:TPR repeat protein
MMNKGLMIGFGVALGITALAGNLEARVAENATEEKTEVVVEQSYCDKVLSYEKIAKKHRKATGHVARLDVINDWENYLKQDISQVERVKVLYNIGVHGTALSPHRYRKKFERALEALRQVANQTLLPTYQDDACELLGNALAQDAWVDLNGPATYEEAMKWYQRGLELGGDRRRALESRIKEIRYHIQRTQW